MGLGRRGGWAWAAGAAWTLGVSVCAWSQVVAPADPAQPAGDGAKAEKDAKAEAEESGTTRTVYFRADAEIGERLARALAYQRNRDYREAFDQYLAVLRLEKPTLFRVDDNLYVNTRDFCLAKIRELPADFLKSYRLTVDGEARSQLERASASMDTKALEELSRRYVASSVEDEILDRLGEAEWEQGRPGGAAAAWERLLIWCPDTGKDRGMIRVKAATAAMEAGNPTLAEAMAAEFEKEDAGRKLVIAGKEVDGKEYLRGLVGGSGAESGKREVDRTRRWEEFGGGPERGGLMPASYGNDSRLWSFGLPGAGGAVESTDVTQGGVNQRVVIRGAGQMRVIIADQGMPRVASGGYGAERPFLPVYADGRLYVNNGWGVASLETRSGKLCWATPGYSGAGSTGSGGNTQGWAKTSRSCVVRDGVVYATVRGDGGGMVMALEADSGRMRWMAPAGEGTEYAMLKGASDVSDPLVVGERLYVGVVTREWGQGGVRNVAGDAGGVFNGYQLMCISLKDRHVLWTTPLCGSSVSLRIQVYGAIMQTSPGVPAYGQGTVYVNTGLGGLGAVDALTGEVKWGYAYERLVMIGGNWGGNLRSGAPRKTYVPVLNAGPVVVGSVVCAAPSDSELLYGLDAQTGRTLWKTPREQEATILGGVDGTLYLSGVEVWWVDTGTGKVKRWSNEPLGFGGQGFVTEDSLYVPTPDCIWRFERKTGKLGMKITLDREKEESGNLILVDGQMLSVGEHEVHVFEEWGKARVSLLEAVQKNPADPVPYERLGQGQTRRREWSGAIKDYRSALKCYQSRGGAGDQASGLKVKQVLYGLYEQVTDEAMKSERHEEGLGLAQEMQALAPDTKSRLGGLTRVVEFQEKLGRWKDVATSLEGVLEQCPDVMRNFEGTTETSAGLWAELEIEKLIRAQGRSCYEEFDRKAGELTASGRPEDYQRVLKLYPNSVHVGEALLGMSRIAGNSGQYREAGRYLDRLIKGEYLKEEAERANAVWLAGNYWEHAGYVKKARGWYKELAAKYPTMKLTIDGVQRTVGDVVKEKLASKSFLEVDIATLVTLGVPLTERWRMSAQMGLPQEGMMFGDGENSGLMVRTETGDVACLDLKTGKMRWRQPFFALRQVATSAKGVVMLGGNNEVTMLDGERGQRQWKYSVGKFVQTMSADEEQVVLSVLDPARGTNVIVCLGTQDGAVAWQTPMKMPRGQVWVALSKEQVVCVSVRPVGVILLNRKTGTVVQEIMEPGDGFLQGTPTVVNDERLLFGVMQQKEQRNYIACYDLKKGVNLWRVVPPGDQVGFRGLQPGNRSVVEGGKRVVIGTSQHTVTCMEVETGQTAWQKTTSSVPYNDVITVGSGEDCYVMSLRLNAAQRSTTITKLAVSDGALKWRIELPDRNQGADMIVTNDEVVVPGATFGMDPRFGNNVMAMGTRVNVVDRETGKVIQSLSPTGADKVRAQPYPILKVVTAEGRLWVVSTQTVVGYGSRD